MTLMRSVSLTRNSATPCITVCPVATDAATDKTGYSSIIEAARSGGTAIPVSLLWRTRISAIFSPPSIRSLLISIVPPISRRVVINPVRRGFIPTAGMVISLSALISAATMTKAADEGSPGTKISLATSSASPAKVTRWVPSALIS